MVSFAIMVPLNMLFAIMVGSYHNRKFAIMVFAIMVGSYHNRKFAIMVFAIMVWNPRHEHQNTYYLVLYCLGTDDKVIFTTSCVIIMILHYK